MIKSWKMRWAGHVTHMGNDNFPIWCTESKGPYFPAYSAHLMYNAHPKLFRLPFEVQITRT
jgi:hypothetical protein